MCECVSILSDGNGGGKVAQFIFGSDKTDSDTYFSVNPRYNCICGRIKWSAGYINTRTHTDKQREAAVMQKTRWKHRNIENDFPPFRNGRSAHKLAN